MDLEVDTHRRGSTRWGGQNPFRGNIKRRRMVPLTNQGQIKGEGYEQDR